MKNEKFSAVSEQTLKTILQFGLNAVTFSRISEGAGVSRGWLYKYVGKRPEDLIRAAALHFGTIAARLGEPTLAQDRESYLNHLVWALERLSVLSTENPWFLPLYHRYKGTPTLLGEVIAQIEEKLQNERIADIRRCIPNPKMPPKNLAEIIIAADLALAFRWQHFPQKNQANLEEFRESARILFAGIL